MADKILSAHVYDITKREFSKFNGNYFEIGIFNGQGTAEIANLFPERTIYALDPFIEDGYTLDNSLVSQGENMETQRQAAYRNLGPYANVTIIEMLSSEFAKHLMAEDIIKFNVSWVVIDGSHHYEDVIVDAEMAKLLIDTKQGAIVFDDLQHEGVMQAYEEFKAKYAFRIVGEQLFGFEGSCGVLELGKKV